MTAVAILGIGTSPAAADFRLRIENVSTGEGVVVTDNSGLIILANGSIPGGFSIPALTAVSIPPFGGPPFTSAALELSGTILYTNPLPGTIRLNLESTDYQIGSSPVYGSFISNFTDLPGSTITARSWINPNNLVPNYGDDTVGPLDPLGAPPDGSLLVLWDTVNGNPIPPVDAITFGPGDNENTALGSRGFSSSGPYSLFLQVDINFTGPVGTVSFSETQTVVPAPAGLVLAVIGLPFLGFSYLRRRLSQRSI
jgi:hypothetical protein